MPDKAEGRFVKLPHLYAILDIDLTRAAGRDPSAVASAFFEGGVRLIQIRAKNLPGGELLALSRAVVAEARSVGATVIINDRPDVAVLARADGVHVGQDDLPPAAVRRVMPSGILGLSTHTREQLEAALDTPATYVAVGPVFGTATKDTGYTPVGLEFVRWAAAHSDRPIVAIGGIGLENIREVIAAGAASAAVISELLRGDPGTRARDLTARTAG